VQGSADHASRAHPCAPHGHLDAVAVSDGRAHLDPVADGDDDADAVPNGHGHVHPDSRADRDEDPHALPNGHGQRRL
jgi:hypothetical protein